MRLSLDREGRASSSSIIVHRNEILSCFIIQLSHVCGMKRHEITLPLDARGKPCLPLNAGRLPIVPLLEALVTAGWSDQQVRQALRSLVLDSDRSERGTDGKVTALLPQMT